MPRKFRYVSVVGSRNASLADVENAMKSVKLNPKYHAIVSGGAGGADTHAKTIALRDGFHYVEVPANWDGPLKKQAGIARNTILVDIADAVIAVWDGKSKGTKDTIDKAEDAGVKIEVFLALEGAFGPYDAGKEAATRGDNE
jgi:hypothetical protein